MRQKHHNRRGFALVIVLSLMTILVLIIYAISLIGRVDNQLGATAVYQTQARQNALLGLRLSLAKLQQTAGALSSVTGSAEVLSTSLPENSRWTGVWQNLSATPIWLVSGESLPSDFSASFSFGATSGSNPPPVISDLQDNVVLVGNGSTNTTASRYLSGDAVLVPKEMISVQSASSSLTVELGHYAYWVGDEGVKLSAQLPGVNPPPSPAPSVHGINKIEYSWTPDTSNLANVVSYEQLSESGAGSTTRKTTFHSVTLQHLGFIAGNIQRTGLVNVNTALSRVWQGVAGTFDSGTTLYRRRNFANEIIDASGSGPYLTVDEFLTSAALENAVDRLSGVTVAEFRSVMEDWFTVRSDTFRIRAYGDAMNPADEGVAGATPESVAYCEAIVQRTNQDAPLGNGKKFVITYFRWLGPDDI